MLFAEIILVGQASTAFSQASKWSDQTILYSHKTFVFQIFP